MVHSGKSNHGNKDNYNAVFVKVFRLLVLMEEDKMLFLFTVECHCFWLIRAGFHGSVRFYFILSFQDV